MHCVPASLATPGIDLASYTPLLNRALLVWHRPMSNAKPAAVVIESRPPVLTLDKRHLAYTLLVSVHESLDWTLFPAMMDWFELVSNRPTVSVGLGVFD